MSTLKVDNIRHNNATSDAITMASDGTCTAKLTSVGGAPLSHRNLIINGQFMIWQKATDSGSNTTDGYLSCDRWYHASSGATKQVTRQAFTPGQTDVPDNPKYYLRYAVTTGNNNVALRQRIEDVTRVQGEMTFSFWVKGSNPGGGNFNLTFRQNFGAGGSASNVVDQGIADYTVSNTWTKKTFTFTPNSISGKTIGTTETTSYYEIELFRQPAGDTSTAAFTVDFANIQLERGSVSTSFEQRSYGDELASCHRYYYIIKEGASLGMGAHKTSSQMIGNLELPQVMRVTPTATATGLNLRIDSGITLQTSSSGSFTLSEASNRAIGYKMTGFSGLTSGSAFFVKWHSSGGNLELSAEL